MKFAPTHNIQLAFAFNNLSELQGQYQKARIFSYGKYKLHGYKFEASVFLIGVCIGYTFQARDGLSGLEILEFQRFFYNVASTVNGEQKRSKDEVEGCEKFETLWAIKLNNKYLIIKECFERLRLFKNLLENCFAAFENCYNRDIP